MAIWSLEISQWLSRPLLEPGNYFSLLFSSWLDNMHHFWVGFAVLISAVAWKIPIISGMQVGNCLFYIFFFFHSIGKNININKTTVNIFNARNVFFCRWNRELRHRNIIACFVPAHSEVRKSHCNWLSKAAGQRKARPIGRSLAFQGKLSMFLDWQTPCPTLCFCIMWF